MVQKQVPPIIEGEAVRSTELESLSELVVKFEDLAAELRSFTNRRPYSAELPTEPELPSVLAQFPKWTQPVRILCVSPYAEEAQNHYFELGAVLSGYQTVANEGRQAVEGAVGGDIPINAPGPEYSSLTEDEWAEAKEIALRILEADLSSPEDHLKFIRARISGALEALGGSDSHPAEGLGQ